MAVGKSALKFELRERDCRKGKLFPVRSVGDADKANDLFGGVVDVSSNWLNQGELGVI